MSKPILLPYPAALLTGMHEFRNGVTHTIPRQQLHESAVLVPELLKSVGYLSGFIGKWHLETNLAPEKGGLIGALPTNPDCLKHFDTTFVRNRNRFQTKGYREDIFLMKPWYSSKKPRIVPFFAIFPPTLHTHPLTHLKHSSNHFERLD